MAANGQDGGMVDVLDTHHKALSINLDAKIYGSFAEIGAGQEVARWFLRVGAASGTVAKTISAYDKEVSDDLYGVGTRYVSRERLDAMLDREWELLRRQLGAARESNSRLFVFADTVAARNFAGTNECHGWVGLRFQTRPGGDPQDVVLHVNLMDDANLLQQEAIGVLGVNLVHGAFHRRATPEDFLTALFDDLAPGRLEVDFVAFRGAELQEIDPRLALVELVRQERAEGVVFPADGRLIPPTELLHGCPVVLEPGQFAQAQSVFSGMLTAALAQLRTELAADARPPATLYVLPIRPAGEDATAVAAPEILRRVDALRATGHGVLVFRHRELYRMIELVSRFTEAPIRFVIGVSMLADVFHDRGNETLDGALLEALARLFARNVRVYAYPMRADVLAARLAGSPASAWAGDMDAAAMVTADRLRVEPPHCYLYQYLLHTGFIVPLSPG